MAGKDAAGTTRVEYDRRAPDYHRARDLPLDALEPLRRALAAYLTSHSSPVLDVGAGTGHFARAFAEWFAVDVVGIEPSAGMREEARRLNAHRRVYYVAGRAEALPVRGGSCAAAWLSTVIHHVADLRACARELRRALVPGGPVLIRSAFPDRLDRITLFRYFPEARRVAEAFPSIECAESAFRSAGFALEHVEDIPQVSAPSHEEMLRRVRAHGRADSTLAGLSAEEFGRGVRALESAVAAREPSGAVVDHLTLLVMR
jgi:ubiquinone/menaquinone biosynthesis C-methylase UbiE